MSDTAFMGKTNVLC